MPSPIPLVNVPLKGLRLDTHVVRSDARPISVIPSRATIAVLALGVLTVPAPVLAQEPQPPPDPCAAADRLREANEDKEARKLYVELIKDDPTLECAETGLAELNEPAPDTSEADAEEKATADAEQQCARGDALRRVNRDDDAIDAYKKALEKNPEAACAEEGLEAAGPSRAKRFVDGIPDVLGDLALFLGLLAVLLFAILLLGYLRPVRQPLLRFPPTGRILAPRFNIAALTDETDLNVGAAISARAKDKLLRMRDEATGRKDFVYDLNVATASERGVDITAGDPGLQSALDKASEVSEHAKVVTALLSLLYTLLPIRRLSIEGVVEPQAEKDCASATLTLTRNRTLRAASTLKGPVAKDPEKLTASDYIQLAEPAAVWMQYEVARAIRDDDEDEEFTSSAAEAYALIREGLGRFAAGDTEQARKFYGRALEANPRSWTARVNLAMTEAQLAGNYDVALLLLARGWEQANR